MKKSDFPYARSKDLVVQQAGNEMLVYDLTTSKAYCLNETSALIWKMSDGKSRISEISNRMEQKLGVPVSDDIVMLALDQMYSTELMTPDNYLKNRLSLVPRREAIKRIGFTSLIALPIVTSLVVPKATMAQSCFAINTSCTAGTDCCSGNCEASNTCCASLVANGIPPGANGACGGDQVDCTSDSLIFCCSGSGTLGPQGTCPVNTFQCICD